MLEIREQYRSMQYMGHSLNRRGIRRSRRVNKGQGPDRYIDDNFVKIFMEDNNLEDLLVSDGEESISEDEEILSDSKDNFIYSDTDGEAENVED
jgi:hypothetical protein